MSKTIIDAWKILVGRPVFTGGGEDLHRALPWIPVAGALLGAAAGLTALLIIAAVGGNMGAAALMAALIIPPALWWLGRGAGLAALMRAVRVFIATHLEADDPENALVWSITATQVLLLAKIVVTGLLVAYGGALWLAVAPLIGAVGYGELLQKAAGEQAADSSRSIPPWAPRAIAAVGVLFWTALMGSLLSGVIAVVLFGLAFPSLAAGLERADLDTAALAHAVAEFAELCALFLGLVLTLITLP